MSGKFLVEGYSFETEAEAKMAINELEGVNYLEKRTNFEDVNSVLDVYNKVIDKGLFRTPIGYSFLKELQDILVDSGEIELENIQPIPVVASRDRKGKKEDERRTRELKKLGSQEEKLKNIIAGLSLTCGIIVIIFIVFIIFTKNSDNINITNYKARLDRQYQERENELAIWSNELKEKENRLKDKNGE